MVAFVASAAIAASPPTKGQCAAAWNRNVHVTRIARANRAWQATVEALPVTTVKFTWSKSAPPTSTESGGYGCAVLLLRGRDPVDVSGLWTNGAVPAWHSRRLRSIEGSGNACVAADGTIHHIGRFTASSRCRRHP